MIYFVRHGKTDWNDLKKMQGVVDIPLNDEGITYAKKLGEKLSNIKFDKVFCSPLTRARQTCEIIFSENKNNLEVEYAECLKEIDYKQYAGQTKSSFDYNGFWDFSRKENFENFYNFCWPIAKFIYNVLLKDYKNKNVLIVSHGGVGKIFELLLSENALSPEKIGDYLPKNSDYICYDLSFKYGKTYTQNISRISGFSNNGDTIVITPNIVSKKVKGKELSIFSDMPKLYEREAVILTNTIGGGQIAVFSFYATKEIKLPGWKKSNLSVKDQIKRRTGFNIIVDSLKEELSTVEITFNNCNGEVIFSKYYSAVIDNNADVSLPDFNEKEKKEGASLCFCKLFELNSKFKENIKKIKSLDPEDTDYRPIESKQSISLRDRAVLEAFNDKILINYIKKRGKI